jgi:hypothetical protein
MQLWRRGARRRRESRKWVHKLRSHRDCTNRETELRKRQIDSILVSPIDHIACIGVERPDGRDTHGGDEQQLDHWTQHLTGGYEVTNADTTTNLEPQLRRSALRPEPPRRRIVSKFVDLQQF